MLTAMLLVAWCAAPPDVAGPPGMAAPPPSLRRIAEITGDLDTLSRRDTQAQTDAERAAVAYEMTVLYRELQRDPRLVASDALREAKLRLWNKLTRIKKEILSQLKRSGRPVSTLTDAEVLALADAEDVAASLADHLALAGYASGGPGMLLAHSQPRAGARGGGAGPPDYGPDLVNLIQQTIVPEFWDVHGGPGTIVYYRPLMCLVVRATSDIHHRLGGTLDALGRVR